MFICTLAWMRVWWIVWQVAVVACLVPTDVKAVGRDEPGAAQVLTRTDTCSHVHADTQQTHHPHSHPHFFLSHPSPVRPRTCSRTNTRSTRMPQSSDRITGSWSMRAGTSVARIQNLGYNQPLNFYQRKWILMFVTDYFHNWLRGLSEPSPSSVMKQISVLFSETCSDILISPSFWYNWGDNHLCPTPFL